METTDVAPARAAAGHRPVLVARVAVAVGVTRAVGRDVVMTNDAERLLEASSEEAPDAVVQLPALVVRTATSGPSTSRSTTDRRFQTTCPRRTSIVMHGTSCRASLRSSRIGWLVTWSWLACS